MNHIIPVHFWLVKYIKVFFFKYMQDQETLEIAKTKHVIINCLHGLADMHLPQQDRPLVRVIVKAARSLCLTLL